MGKEHETILDYINLSNKFIDKALGDSSFNVVFIHCREGRSRSVSFLCCYLMWKESMSFIAALSDIRSKRHIVLPNNKFYRELEKFDKEIIVDREENNCKKFGSANKSFKLMKVAKNDKQQCVVIDDAKESENESEDVPKMRMGRSNSVTSPREKKRKKGETELWKNRKKRKNQKKERKIKRKKK